ncbi:toprim domain-containing protein [Metabacillus halosaccharovorans]|uniref:toprim domain-containing protein n=1 Tax=Metabacillus halosaccharovorans TaxID=930124 RepID=UPI0020405CF4|nr:toprim domain-containing protein [Metabacillus halosaccharovorans]MCM3439349.1 DUF2399 domain-containing protein [Metabacillus halosaccharovorans]
MIEESLHKYIKDFILKSGEELEWNHPTNEDVLIEIKMIKRSERTYRVLGLILLSKQAPQTEEMLIDEKLEAIAFTTRKKVSLDDRDRQTFRWLEEGWIMKEVRFEKDEKTVRNSHYRMGFRLYQHEQVKIQQKLEQTQNEFLNIKSNLLAMYESKSDKQQRDYWMQNIIMVINQLNPNDLSTSLSFSKTWSLQKRLKYLHFVCAFCQLSFQKEEFDWKEIGASYFQKIGGSKEFDSYKQEFIDRLEEWTNVPVDELGLMSLGQITPVFFAGQLSGKYAVYHWGAVHALTNLAIANETYETKATTLWLVENRAILTRMAAAEQFLEETNSLMICIDGHLRSAHKKAISQILSNSEVEQVIIWCDYDLDGLHISKEIHRVVNQYNELTLKWILPDQEVTGQSDQYEQYVTSFLQHNKMEQELILGGEEQWKSWILA